LETRLKQRPKALPSPDSITPAKLPTEEIQTSAEQSGSQGTVTTTDPTYPT